MNVHAIVPTSNTGHALGRGAASTVALSAKTY